MRRRFAAVFALTCLTSTKEYKGLRNDNNNNKTLRSVHFGVVVVELIKCKCGGIVKKKYGKNKVLICEIVRFVSIF